MRFDRFAHTPMALLFVGVSGVAGAQAQPGGLVDACFEVIVPRRQTPPAPLLVNRCTGATWLLMRTGEAGVEGGRVRLPYRWVALEADRPLPAGREEHVTAPSTPSAKAAIPGKNCFEFTGRRFCE